MIFRSQNGREMDWEQFAPFMQRCCLGRWGGRYPDVAQDALGDTFLALWEFWQHYPKAKNEDGSLRLEYAVWYGIHRFDRYFRRELKSRSALADEQVEGLYSIPNRFETSHSQESEVIEFLQGVDPDVLRDWFKNLQGTVEEQARAEGVSHQAITDRRRRRKSAMKRAWNAYKQKS